MNQQLPIIQVTQTPPITTQLYLNEEQIEDSFQKRLKAQQDEIMRNQQVIDSQMKTLEQQNIMLSLNHTKLSEQAQLINNQAASIQYNSNVFTDLNQKCQSAYEQMMSLNNTILEHQKYLEQQSMNEFINSQQQIYNDYVMYNPQSEPQTKRSRRRNKK